MGLGQIVRDVLKKPLQSLVVPIAASLVFTSPGVGMTKPKRYDIQLCYVTHRESAYQYIDLVRRYNLPSYTSKVKGKHAWVLRVDTNCSYDDARTFISLLKKVLPDTDAYPVEDKYSITKNQLIVSSDQLNDFELYWKFRPSHKQANTKAQKQSYTNKKQNEVYSKTFSRRKNKQKLSNRTSTNRNRFASSSSYSSNHTSAKKVLEDITKDEFVNAMSAYIAKEYKDGCYNKTKKELPTYVARNYAAWIYDAASFYELDPFLLLSIPNHETYFKNMDGDLHHYYKGRLNHSEGMFQMLKSTQQLTYEDMKKRNLDYLISWRPGDDLKDYPHDQAYMAAHYLKYFCFSNKYKPTRRAVIKALTAYNGSSSYAYKVLRLYKRSKNFYNEYFKYYNRRFAQNFNRSSF